MNNSDVEHIYLTIFEKFFLFRLEMVGRLPYSDKIKTLLELDLIAYDLTDKYDPFGAPIPLADVHLTEKYRRYKAYRRNWFSLEYVVSHILVPIAAGVLASVITSRLIP